jgi:hypothetical protein
MKPEELFVSPMILVSHETGNRYPAFKGWTAKMDDDLTMLQIISKMQTGPYMFAEPDAISIVDISDKKKRIQVTDERGLSYTIRPVNDTDSEWLFSPIKVSLPSETTEEILSALGEILMSKGPGAAGTPSVMAFTRDGDLEAVSFDIAEVATYFRVDGKWTLESPIEIEDTDMIRIQPKKAEEFVNKWDEKDGNLSKELNDYAAAEEE